jgi:hypothetical protein
MFYCILTLRRHLLRTLFLGVVDFMVIPILMLSFVNDPWLGFVLNVFTVLAFTGKKFFEDMQTSTSSLI